MSTVDEVRTTTSSTGAGRLERRAFTAALLARVPDALVVTGLGSPSYDVHAAGHRVQNFHLWGAMGLAVPVGLGLALAQPARSVLVVTGDGEQLMGIGSLATAAAQRPDNLTVVVLDNGRFGETGMQVSHTSLGTDLVAAARAFGVPRAYEVEALEDHARVADDVLSRSGFTFARVPITTGEPPRSLPPRDSVANKNSFRADLGLPTF